MSWKKNRLMIGGGLLVVLLGLTIWVVQTKTGETPVDENRPTLPEIDAGALTSISIERPEDDHATVLRKEGEAWRVVEPLEAESDERNVTTLVETLADLRIVRVAATRAATHERLEVDEDHGIRVIARAGDRVIFDGWIGGVMGGATMLRLEGQDTVLAVRTETSGSIKFAFNRALRDMRNRRITDLTPTDIHAVAWANEHGTFSFRQAAAEGEEEGAWEIASVEIAPPAPTAGEGAEGTPPAPPTPPAPAAGEGAAATIERFDAGRVRTRVTGLAHISATDFAGPDVTVESAGVGEDAPSVTLTIGEGAEEQTLVMRVGNESDEESHSRYLRVEGRADIYVISRASAERMIPNVDAFQTPEPGSEPPTPPPSPLGGPGGLGGEGGEGGGITPEQMRMIQQQLQQQLGGRGHAPPH